MRKHENPFTFYDKEKSQKKIQENRQITKAKQPELSSMFHSLAEACSNMMLIFFIKSY
jgi:hypothetical protein